MNQNILAKPSEGESRNQTVRLLSVDAERGDDGVQYRLLSQDTVKYGTLAGKLEHALLQHRMKVNAGIKHYAYYTIGGCSCIGRPVKYGTLAEKIGARPITALTEGDYRNQNVYRKEGRWFTI